MKRPTVEMLVSAYAQGVFPMAHADEEWEVYWYAPDPRAILELDQFHISKNLARTVRQKKFDVRIDTAFEEVMHHCASVERSHESGTWISEGLLEAYIALHKIGIAHSVEAWQEDRLVGGLYGVALRGLFAGESMFHLETDASKVCLVHLVEHLRDRRFVLHDIQFMTEHLRTFGAIEIPREQYEERLLAAMEIDAEF